jgi:hypothetical protein
VHVLRARYRSISAGFWENGIRGPLSGPSRRKPMSPNA